MALFFSACGIPYRHYSLAIEKLYGKLPQSANLLDMRKEKRLSYDSKQDAVAKSREEMTTLIDGTLNERFGPKPDYNTCPFRLS